MEPRVVDAPMRAYYEARAAEYDDWWLGSGRFAGRERPGWEADVHALIAMLEALTPASTLDVACGTAFLTRHLPGQVTALDLLAELGGDGTVLHRGRWFVAVVSGASG